MECASHRLSHATLRLRIFSELYISKPGPRFLNRLISTSSAHLSPVHDEAPFPTPPSSSSSTKDHTPPSQRLPQSPVITHPRSGVKKVYKPRQGPETSSDLSKNPWALALASPVRFCVTTGTRLPRRLMGEYGLVKRPDTNNNYLLPVDLLRDSIQRRLAESEGDSLTSESGASPDVNLSPGGNVSPSLSLHMVTLRPLMQAVTPQLASRAGKRPGVSKLIPYRWKFPVGPLNSNDLRACVWRTDMPDYLLRQMRKKVFKRILNFGATLEMDRDIVWKSLHIDECSNSALKAALGRMGPLENESCGAILFFGPKPGYENESGAVSTTALNPRTQATIPVFDLSVLLSEKELDALRASSSPHLQKDALFFRPNGGSEDTKLMLFLWKLQRYLAENS